MKKRVFCLLLALSMCLCLSAQAVGSSFYRHLQYGNLVSYENLVYGYSLRIFEGFEMLDDESLDHYWQHLQESQKEGSDEIYDIRIWIPKDNRYEFSVEVKQPTYDSFETEIAKAPEYLDLVRDGYPEESNVRMLHDGIVRDTSAGRMLETAIAYDMTDSRGQTFTIVFLYYDIYAGGVAYCFSLSAYDGDYDAAHGLLDEICQTVTLKQTDTGYLA